MILELLSNIEFSEVFGFGAACAFDAIEGGLIWFKSLGFTGCGFLRDGPSTDSLSSEFISRLSANGNKVSKCNFLIACTLADYPAEEFNNYCGVPHSLLSHAENEIITPFNLYWENNMIANILGFFNGKSDSLVDLSTDKAVCSSVPSSFIGKQQFAKMGPTYIKGCQKYFK